MDMILSLFAWLMNDGDGSEQSVIVIWDPDCDNGKGCYN